MRIAFIAVAASAALSVAACSSLPSLTIDTGHAISVAASAVTAAANTATAEERAGTFAAGSPTARRIKGDIDAASAAVVVARDLYTAVPAAQLNNDTSRLQNTLTAAGVDITPPAGSDPATYIAIVSTLTADVAAAINSAKGKSP